MELKEKTLPLNEIVEKCLKAFANFGFSMQESFDTVRALMYGELRGGKSYHGLDRIPWIIQQHGRTFHTHKEVTIREKNSRLIHLEGNHGLGYSQMYQAVLAAVVGLRSSDIIAVALHDSYPTNCLGDYASILAGHGFISYVGTVSPPRVTLPQGSLPKLSTSGQAFGFPSDPPIVLDFSIGAMTNGDLLNIKKNGLSLPEGACLDKEGRPTTDVTQVLDDNNKIVGSILPRGGKDTGHILAGFGVVMMLTAAECGLDLSSHGSFLVARKTFIQKKNVMDEQIRKLLANETNVFLPGQRSYLKAIQLLKAGFLTLEDSVWSEIIKLSNTDNKHDPIEIAGLATHLLDQIRTNQYAPIQAELIKKFE